MIGDSHAMSVATQISQDLLWAAERTLGIDPPLASAETGEQSLEGEWLSQVGVGAMEGEFAVFESARERFQEELSALTYKRRNLNSAGHKLLW